jgi:hypothetical protein
LTIAATTDKHHYQSPSGTDVTHSSPSKIAGRRQRDAAQRVLARLRLPRQEWERHPLAIAAGVPDGSVRAAGEVQWTADCRAHPALAHLRSDAWDSAMNVVRSLANRTDWQLGTARPTWAVLMADTGLSRRTIARYLALLRAAGLLGVVATGRTAAATPMALDDGINAAAVYVLTVPHALHLVTSGRHEQDQPEPSQEHQGATPAGPAPALTRATEAVDEDGTPSPSPLVTGKDKPTHARASAPSALGDLTRAEVIAAGGPCWALGINPLGKNDRLRAAAELVRQDPVLGRITVRHVAALLREWHLAGFTPLDVLHALHYRPDGSPWPHQLTVADVVDVPGWVRYRLAAWRQDPQDRTSPPAASPSRRVLAEHTLQAARARARAERDEALRAERVAPTAAMAAAKALHAARQLARKYRGNTFQRRT